MVDVCWMCVARLYSSAANPMIKVSFSMVIGCVTSIASQKDRLLTRSFKRLTHSAQTEGSEAVFIEVWLLKSLFRSDRNGIVLHNAVAKRSLLATIIRLRPPGSQ